MAKLMRLATVEKLLREMGYKAAADDIAGKAAAREAFKLHPRVLAEIEKRMNAEGVVAIARGGRGRHKIQFLKTDHWKRHWHFCDPEKRKKALAAKHGHAELATSV